MADRDRNVSDGDDERPTSRWLRSPDHYHETDQGDYIDITWRSPEATAEITADPGYGLVRLHYDRHLELTIAEGVDADRSDHRHPVCVRRLELEALLPSTGRPEGALGATSAQERAVSSIVALSETRHRGRVRVGLPCADVPRNSQCRRSRR